jgi:hypothetical protein
MAQSEALRPLGAARFSRVRVLTFLPDRLQILFPIPRSANLFECVIFPEENAQCAQSTHLPRGKMNRK